MLESGGEASMGRGVVRICLKLLLVAGLGLLGGCFGVTQNPSYFPHLLPAGDIIRTHAKPPSPSYYSNFDPHAVKLEVRPVEMTNPVRTQQVLIATVYDEKGNPRRGRRVEWMIEGSGNIIEADESGFWPGRGYKVDNKYAVSYTAYSEHRITRGNANPNDDFMIRPGQSWCVVSSAVEGDTHVTVYAPGINDWDKHKVFVATHWVDAEWVLPLPSVNRAGTDHVITTNIFRHTDRQPLANYRVRYRILDGPPAVFLPHRTQETVVISDLSGNAHATLAQVSPLPGINRISVEVIRPPDPTSPSGSGIVIARGETTKEWQAPQIAINLTGPPQAVVGQDIPYTITVTNSGPVETQALTVRDVLPENLQFVRSDPRAVIDGNQLIWTLGVLSPGRSYTLQVTLRGASVGTAQHCASVTTGEGFRAEKCLSTQITGVQQAQLKVTMSEQPTAQVGVPFTYQLTVSNPGTGPAAGVVLNATFDAALEHDSRAKQLQLPLGDLAGGDSRTVPLILKPRQVGRFSTKVVATAAGGLKSEVEQIVTVQASSLQLKKTGPKARYVDQSATFDITVENTGDTPLSNVVIRDQLSPELSFQSATGLGQVVNGQVVWNIGTLAAKEQKTVQMTARCLKMAADVLNTAVVTADPGLQETAEAHLEVRGIPAYLLEITKAGDPLQVGAKMTYKVAVTNTGSLPGNEVSIAAIVPAEMQVGATDGPNKAQIDNNRVTFPPLDGLQPKQTWNYSIEVQGLRPGDVRFRVELRGSGLSSAVVKEESTNIYVPPNGTPPGETGR
jgi:uncharacterized repeat protein (TIGR01451 family)